MKEFMKQPMYKYYNITEKNIECVNKVTEYMISMMDEGTLNFNALLVGFVNIIMLFNPRFDDYTKEFVDFISNYYCFVSSTYGRKVENDVSKLYAQMNNRDSPFLPFISPRGTFGLNVFLYLFFNGISPIGISSRPWEVYGGIFKDDPNLATIHDFGHYFSYSKMYPETKQKLMRVYDYIINNQEKIGNPDKVKGLIIYLFYVIHEGLEEPEPNPEEWNNYIISAIYGFPEDFWSIMKGNKYYDASELENLDNFRARYVNVEGLVEPMRKDFMEIYNNVP